MKGQALNSQILVNEKVIESEILTSHYLPADSHDLFEESCDSLDDSGNSVDSSSLDDSSDERDSISDDWINDTQSSKKRKRINTFREEFLPRKRPVRPQL